MTSTATPLARYGLSVAQAQDVIMSAVGGENVTTTIEGRARRSRSVIGGYVDRAKQAVAQSLTLKSGYSLEWSGQYENMIRVRERLKIVVPLTIFTIFFLLYMNTKSTVKAGIVMLAVPFSIVGAVWLMYVLDYNVSIAAWVGMIALMGLDAETGVFMLSCALSPTTNCCAPLLMGLPCMRPPAQAGSTLRAARRCCATCYARRSRKSE